MDSLACQLENLQHDYEHCCVAHLKILFFRFEGHVMMKLVHISCQKPHLHSKLVPNDYLVQWNPPLTAVIVFVHGWQSICNGFLGLLLVRAWA